MAKRALPQAGPVPHWADESGLVHICEGNAPLNNELLIWTLCDREVESGMAFIPSRDDEVTCRKCIAAELVLERRRETAQGRLTLA